MSGCEGAIWRLMAVNMLRQKSMGRSVTREGVLR